MAHEKSLLEQYFEGMTHQDLLNFGAKDDPQNVRKVIAYIQKMMKNEAGNITYTQLRNILQTVKKDSYKNEPSSFLLTIPKLAYMEARPQKKPAGRKIITFIRELAEQVEYFPQEYEAFEEIMNTIVAYHKLHA